MNIVQIDYYRGVNKTYEYTGDRSTPEERTIVSYAAICSKPYDYMVVDKGRLIIFKYRKTFFCHRKDNSSIIVIDKDGAHIMEDLIK